MTKSIQLNTIIPDDLAGLRLDQALAELFPQHSRSRLRDWIRDQKVTVNGESRKPRDRVAGGEAIEILAPPEEQTQWIAQAMSLDIVFEDQDIIIVNKPAGLVVHPAAGNPDGTLINGLLHHAPSLDQLPRAGMIHRLDKDTSGLLCFAKTLEAHTSLVNQMQKRTIGRIYEAIVVGEMSGGGTIEAPIGRHPIHRKRQAIISSGRPARTHYRIIDRFPAHTHLKVQLDTGRTHQIRVHMAHIKHPLVGDPVYGKRMVLPKGATEELKRVLQNFKRQALHARELKLTHPQTKEELSFECDLPTDFIELINALKNDKNNKT